MRAADTEDERQIAAPRHSEWSETTIGEKNSHTQSERERDRHNRAGERDRQKEREREAQYPQA